MVRRTPAANQQLPAESDAGAHLRSLRLQNFKCFGGKEVTVPLAPLTLIFGQNNSGKSTLLQSLLLLQQSYVSPSLEATLALSGSLYHAGTYEDIVYSHDTARSIAFGLDLETEDGVASVDAWFSNHEPQPLLSYFGVRSPDGSRLEIHRVPEGTYRLSIDGQDLGGPTEANFAFAAGTFLPIVGDKPHSRGRHRVKRLETRFLAAQATLQMSRMLTVMRAIGPFRRAPARRYEYTGARPLTDYEGEAVVDALIESTLRPKKKGRRTEVDLVKSVNKWLSCLAEVELEVSRLSQRQRLYDVRIRDLRSGRWANFADVGSGIGQALPVFVEGLRTPVGGIYLVQEPETHLHPDAQLVMADFLIDLAMSGRQLLIETHSEHFLLRLRRRLVEQKSDGQEAPDASVLYVSRPKRGASAAVTPLTLDELGQIENWPPGFFEEASRERMALLEAQAALAEGEEQ